MCIVWLSIELQSVGLERTIPKGIRFRKLQVSVLLSRIVSLIESFKDFQFHQAKLKIQDNMISNRWLQSINHYTIESALAVFIYLLYQPSPIFVLSIAVFLNKVNIEEETFQIPAKLSRHFSALASNDVAKSANRQLQLIIKMLNRWYFHSFSSAS